MKIFKIKEDLSNIPYLKAPINLCLGYFDGVHIAHQKLITAAVNHDAHAGGVITFSDNLKQRPCLSSLNDRLIIFKELKVDFVFVLPFSQAIKTLSPESFIKKFLQKLNVASLFLGADYHFGLNAKGDASLLKKYFPTHVIPFFKHDKEKISSFQISKLIEKGKMEIANILLGRPYEVQGEIVSGNQIGRTIKYPTANIKLNFNYVMPYSGVYKTIIYINGIPHLSITNVGYHPTIKRLHKPSVEVHIPNFSENIYGNHVYLDFIAFIRPERKFDSIGQLSRQIASDIKQL